MEVGGSTPPGTTVEGARGISSVGLEHLPCKQGVKGSNPLFSTKKEIIDRLKEDEENEKNTRYAARVMSERGMTPREETREGRGADASAPGGEEGRDKPRKSAGIGKCE